MHKLEQELSRVRRPGCASNGNTPSRCTRSRPVCVGSGSTPNRDTRSSSKDKATCCARLSRPPDTISQVTVIDAMQPETCLHVQRHQQACWESQYKVTKSRLLSGRAQTKTISRLVNLDAYVICIVGTRRHVASSIIICTLKGSATMNVEQF
jgi:hypothetical protein